MKRFLCCLLSLILFCSVSLTVNAEEQEEMIELSNDEYQDYVNNLLRPAFFEEFVNEMTVSAVDLNKDAYKSTNVPKSSGIGSAGGSSVLKDFGKEIIEDIATKIINDAAVDNSGYYMPEFRQQTGKLRNVYNSGLVEIITCTMTTYQTPAVGSLGGKTGSYDNHCILTLIRQIDDYYTITTICDEASKEYCSTYTATGNYIFESYSPNAYTYFVRFFDGAAQETIPNHQILGHGSSIKFKFYDLPVIDEIPNTTGLGTTLFFLVYDRQGLPEFSSGSQYRALNYILTSSSTFSSDSSKASSIPGCAFAVSNTITNDYQDYSQQHEFNETSEQKQAITYLSDINTTNVINKNNIDNYSNITNNFDSWYQSNVTEIVNNNITNVYNNYWITPTDPPVPTDPPTQPPETVPPITQPPTDPPATVPTNPSIVIPTETYYIPELNTETYALELPTIPSMENLPAEITSVSGLIAQQSADFIDDFGMGHVYGVIAILSVAVYIMRGER